MRRVAKLAGFGFMIAFVLAMSACATAQKRGPAEQTQEWRAPAFGRWANRK